MQPTELKMSEPIKIVVTAEVQQAAAALQNFVRNGASEIQIMSKWSAEAGKGFEDLAGKVYYFRSAIDGIRFAAMDGGARAAFYAVDELSRGLAAANIGLAAMAPWLAGVAAAVGAGYVGWKTYMAGVDGTTKSLAGMIEALEKVPDLVGKINKLQKAGLMSPAAASEFADYLGQNPKKKLYLGSDGKFSPNQTSSEARASEYAAQAGLPIEAARAIMDGKPQQTATPAEANEYVNSQLPLVSDKQTESADKYRAVLQKINDESLTGLAAQIQKIKE